MRSAVACLIFLTIGPNVLLRSAQAPVGEPDLTVILDFKGSYAGPAIDEMRRETANILKTSGLHIGWDFASEAAGRSFQEVVVMTFDGHCMFQPVPPRYDELGPYASTLTADGVVQPFGRVDCDHVARSARAAMTSDDYSRGDFLVGRALGRVVAHELVHMLTHSLQHGREGVAKPSLTGKQLIEASLTLSREDVNRLRLELKPRRD